MRLISELKAIRKIFLALAPLLFLTVSCKKDNNVLGVDVQPAGDALNAKTESSQVFGYSMIYDSVISLNDRYKYLGSNQDPVFGRTDVGLYLNPNIPDGLTYLNFGDDANLLSAELILTIRGAGTSYAGVNGSPVSYSVYSQPAQLDPAKVYYTNSADLYSANSLLGSYTGTLTYYQGKLVLRIPINKNYGATVLNNTQYLYSNTIFQDTYKGFYIKCGLSSGEGLIAEFDLEDELSGFWLRYQNGQPPAVKEEKSFRFTFSGTNINPIRFNTMKYQPANGGQQSLVQQLVGHDTTAGASNLFLKGLGGSKVKVFIPALYKRSEVMDLSVNRAEVIFHLDPSVATANYPVPQILALFPIDSTGREIFAQDQLNTTDRVRYSGKYDADNKRYVFDIARHAQAVFTGKIKNYGFYLVVSDATGLATYKPFYNGTDKELIFAGRDHFIERVVLAGSNDPQLRPMLNLTYVPLPND